MLRFFVAAIFCIASAGTASADGSVSRTGMGNGSGADGFRPFDALIRQYDVSRETFRIDSHCQSACTLFLGIRNVCVTPDATLLFHAGHTRGPHRKVNAAATEHMMAAYNGKLRSYLVAGGYMNTLAFHTISGRDMISRFGYRACE